MKKIILSIALVFVLCLAIFVPINQQQVVAESAGVQDVENLINQYYLSDIENVKNRTAGTDGERNMALKLESFLQTGGYDYFANLDSYVQTFELSKETSSQNVIGLKNNASEKYVILGAHYDSVYIENKSFGYSDNLSGVIAVMHTANLLASFSKVNVVVAFFGAEETGCNGSNYFVKNLTKEMRENILLYINFDSVGVGDFQYYYTNDFSAKYMNNVKNYFSSSSIKKYANQLFSTRALMKNVNYSNLPLQSDNLTFLGYGINALSFFAGNLNTTNGLGFFETVGHKEIMHSTDTKETIDSVFGTMHYAENINNISVETANFLNSEHFNVSDFEGNQVQTWAFNIWNLKFCGVILIAVGFMTFLVVYCVKNRNKQQPQKQQGTYYNKNSKKKQKKLEKLNK